ncbi:GNAT family N-acetyltransferase [Halobaculum sp. MBLA0143]|uniref:GNAT family N-acetyltransferase n=1 Tax=Halobaculum sp. MBLA0143 TaxID=3079933 RepID=UPI003526550C
MPGATFIEGRHVELCTVEEEDIPFLRKYLNHPEIQQYYTDLPHNEARVRERYETIDCGENVGLLMVPVDESDPVGYVQIAPIDWQHGTGGLGIWVAPEQQPSRISVDATVQIVDYGFRQLGLHRLEIETMETNAPIIEGAKGVGFTQTGRKREMVTFDGEEIDVVLLDMLRHEWDGTEAVWESM